MAVEPGFNVAGVHCRLEMGGMGGAETTIPLPAPVMPTLKPLGATARVFTTWRAIEAPGLAASVKLTFATTPAERRSVLRPVSRQVEKPTPPVQEIVLRAVVAAAPTVTETAATCEGGN